MESENGYGSVADCRLPGEDRLIWWYEEEEDRTDGDVEVEQPAEDPAKYR